MSAISWVETVPSATSLVGIEPRHLQSVWTAVATGLATNLYWPGSGGGSDASIGRLKPGASRTYVDVISNSSVVNSQATGRVFFATDSTRAVLYDSAGTYLFGTPYLAEMHTPSAFPWVRQTGQTVVASAGTPTSKSVSFADAYGAAPTVWQTFSNTNYLMAISTVTTGGFTSTFSWMGGGSQSLFTIEYWSLGTMSGAV